jgi:hypothetical protein
VFAKGESVGGVGRRCHWFIGARASYQWRGGDTYLTVMGCNIQLKGKAPQV